MKVIALVLAVACNLLAADAAKVASDGGFSPGAGTALPTACGSVGQLFVKTNAAVGEQMYVSTTSGNPCTWSAQGGSVTMASNGTSGEVITSAGSKAVQSSGTPLSALAPKASPTITGHPTIEGVTSTGSTGTGKFVFDTSPTFAGTAVANNLTINGTCTGCGSSAATMQAGSGSPNVGPVNCTAPSGTHLDLYADTSASPRRLWWCSATNTWRLMLDTVGTGTFYFIGTAGTDPCGSVASGQACGFFNSAASNHFSIKDDAQAVHDLQTGGSGPFTPNVRPVRYFLTSGITGGVDFGTPIGLGGAFSTGSGNNTPLSDNNVTRGPSIKMSLPAGSSLYAYTYENNGAIWFMGDNLHLDTRVVNSAITGLRAWVAMVTLPATTVGTDTPSFPTMGFRFSTVAGDSHWMCAATDGGGGHTQTSDSGVTPSTTVMQRLEVIETSGVLTYFINGAQMCGSFVPGFVPAAGTALQYAFSLEAPDSLAKAQYIGPYAVTSDK